MGGSAAAGQRGEELPLWNSASRCNPDSQAGRAVYLAYILGSEDFLFSPSLVQASRLTFEAVLNVSLHES